MANTTTKKEDVKVVEKEEKEDDKNLQEPENQDDGNGEPEDNNQKPEPEKEGLKAKAKKFGLKVWNGAKKAAPVVGGAVIGAGITIGAIAVALAKGEAIDGEVPLLEADDLTKADDFIEGEATVVDSDES